jgi:hypothetical protein
VREAMASKSWVEIMVERGGRLWVLASFVLVGGGRCHSEDEGGGSWESLERTGRRSVGDMVGSGVLKMLENEWETCVVNEVFHINTPRGGRRTLYRAEPLINCERMLNFA